MAICIPPNQAHLQSRMEARYGMAVVPELNQQMFRDIERAFRTKLVGK
jgi:hypothetical protein